MARALTHDRWLPSRQVGWSRPAGLALLWSHRRPVARLALVGVIAATIATAVFVASLPTSRTAVLAAEAAAVQAGARALAPAVSTLGDERTLDGPAYAAVHAAIGEMLLEHQRVGGKLWSLDGVLLYSNSGAHVGQHFPAIQPTIHETIASGLTANAVEVDESGDLTTYDQLLDLYVPVTHHESGHPVAILELHLDRRALAHAYSHVTTSGWHGVWASFVVLAASLAAFIGSTVRAAGRQRVDDEARAWERMSLEEAADGLAHELEVDRLFAALDDRIRPALTLDRFAHVDAAADPGDGFAVRLRDGSHVVADRLQPPLTADDRRVVQACARSLDAAMTNAALYEQVRSATVERRALLRRITTAHEDERRRIVGELHDELAGQLLRALYAVRRLDDGDRTSTGTDGVDLADLEMIITDSERLLRAFMARVRPAAVEDLGLTNAVADAVARFGRESGLPVRLRVRGDADRLDPSAGQALLRVAEEALLNVRKHADANLVRVTMIAREDGVAMVVEDDGRGLDPVRTAGPGRGLGLVYIQERAEAFGGRVVLGRSRLGGARLLVDLPINAT
jgi:signal transduction histidine kinase